MKNKEKVKMSHRRKRTEPKKESPKLESVNTEPYTMEFGPSRLVLRGKELYNGWSGSCQNCNETIEIERPALEGLTCPKCGYQLYEKGNKGDVRRVVQDMEKERARSIDKKTMHLDDQDKALVEMMTAVCQTCGGRLEVEVDDDGGTMMYCPKCMKRAELSEEDL